jgi:hypothetical protein
MHEQHFQSLFDAGWWWDGEKMVHPRHKAAYALGPWYVDNATAQKRTDRLMLDVRQARWLSVLDNILVAAKALGLVGIPLILVFASYWVATRVFASTSWHVAVLFGSIFVTAAVVISLIDDNRSIRLPWKKRN